MKKFKNWIFKTWDNTVDFVNGFSFFDYFVCLLVIFIGLFFMIVLPLSIIEVRESRSPETYQAWQKLTNNTNINYQEWLLLKKGDLIKESTH